MALAEVEGIEGLRSLIGEEVGPGEWREVTQEMIDQFAELSGDDQWIHVDVERAAKESPFGTTVAHGNLTLSLIDGFRRDLIAVTGFALGVNYGWNKVRFPAPVPSGSRARARGEVISVEEAGGRCRRGSQRPSNAGSSPAKNACTPLRRSSVAMLSAIPWRSSWRWSVSEFSMLWPLSSFAIRT